MRGLSVLGSGRWGCFIAWYLNKLGFKITLWGRKESENLENLIKTRRNSLIHLDSNIIITSDLQLACSQKFIIISINSQNLRNFLSNLKQNYIDLSEKKVILCMKGIEESTGHRLSEIVLECFPEIENLAVWVGPGHVKSLTGGIPTCMVIDSENEKFKLELCNMLSSNLIKCFKGDDLVGTEIGAACKNVLGIASGILDAMKMESLKGPLMSFGALEVANLIEKKGGKRESSFGLCHLGDFQATLFSSESNNRKLGESIVTGEKINFVAEGMSTTRAVQKICRIENLNLPIFSEMYKIIYENKSIEKSIEYLFSL